MLASPPTEPSTPSLVLPMPSWRVPSTLARSPRNSLIWESTTVSILVWELAMSAPSSLSKYHPSISLTTLLLGCDYGWLRWDLQEVRQEGCGGAWHSSVCPSVLLRPLGISTNTLPMSATERHCLRFVLVNMSIWQRRSSSLSGSLILVLPACSSSLPFIPSRICAYLGCDCHRCS